ncbi:MAG TPA: DUF4926 domain-containing protein [Pyrinomonadaceae bacterium]|nr:DUF4926 domain-containing protein [Pyrinomonadaceae bacterium]
MQEIKENELVALLVDLPENGLRRGDVGTVIEVFEQTEHHPRGYLIEFVAESGEVYAHADITDESQFVQLRFKREAA